MSLLLLLNQARDPRHKQLFKLARELLEDEKPGLAVVTAQTACEVYAEIAIAEMLKARSLGEFEDVIPKLLSSFSLKDKRGQAVFHALTGEHVQQADFWKRYHEHVERRHAVVHRGLDVTPEEGAASVAAATEFFEYVAATWEKANSRSQETR